MNELGAAPGRSPKLTVDGVTKWFRTRGQGLIHVLDDVAFDVADGEFVSLVGASGCGKTTLLRMIDGLEPYDRGRILLDGAIVSGPGLDRGVVFQQDSLYPWRTVEENVWFGLEAQGRPLADRREAASALVTLVGIAGFEHHYPHELSGGMRQRVNLARAMAIDPGILLMDEPFAALDSQTREVMQRELMRIWDERRKTVLFITHQIDEAVFLSDRVIVLSSRPGRVRADLRIDLPRPRDLHVKRVPAFVDYVEVIWKMIEQEAIRAATS